MAGLAYSVYGYADWIARMGVPFTAEDEFLFAWAGLIGVYPKPSAAATGTANFTGNPGRLLPNQTALTRQDGTPYITTADGTVNGQSSVTVPIAATVQGAFTNDPGNLGNLQRRQQAVCVKFTARGGQSMAYFTAIAETLGYTITITEFAPFRAGINRAGDPVYGAGWAYVWQIIATAPIIYFRAGQSTAGEPLRSWGSRLFECTMDEIKPAHTVLLFGYTQPLEAAHDRRNPDLGPPDRRRMEPGHRGPVRTSLSRRRAADRQDPRPGDDRIGRATRR